MKINSTTDIFGKEKISLPEKLSELRRKLNEKAKNEPKFRFYSLYEHVCREDTLWSAWNLVRKNKGAPGVDNVSIEEIMERKNGVEILLSEIREELLKKSYQPSPVKRVYIPKKNGKLRPLGIPTVKDRVVQMAAMLILEPIFEADFLSSSYGFRPGRSAHQALKEIQKNLKQEFTLVYDADLRSYFDSIPHDKLMKCVEMRIVDRSVLHLIRLWLKTPIAEITNNRITLQKSDGMGTPQGGVISPLLSNIYLHWFDKMFDRNFRKLGIKSSNSDARLVRYADDFVVMYKHHDHNVSEWIESTLENWLGLEINRDKTKIVKLRRKGETLNFLGYSFRMVNSWKTPNMRHTVMYPSLESLRKEKDKIRQMLGNHMGWKPISELAIEVSRQVYGWSQYFSIGYCAKTRDVVNKYLIQRAVRFLRRKGQKGYKFPDNVSRYRYLQSIGFKFLMANTGNMGYAN